MNYVAARRRLRSRTSGIQLHISFDPPIGEYVDYASFSDRVWESSMDASLKAVAEQMAEKMAQSLSAIISLTVDSTTAAPWIVEVNEHGGYEYYPDIALTPTPSA